MTRGLGAICALLVGLELAEPATCAQASSAPIDRASQTPSASAAPPYPAAFLETEFAIGSPRAPVTIVEYLSVTCPHCAVFNQRVWPLAQDKYVATGRVRFIIREMATTPVTVSTAGFLLARCAGSERYWEVVQSMLEQQDSVLSQTSLANAIAEEATIAGLSTPDVAACLSDRAAIEAANARRQSGLDMGVESTPFFVINGQPLRRGVRLGASIYEGGELSWGQLQRLIARAQGQVSTTLKPAM